MQSQTPLRSWLTAGILLAFFVFCLAGHAGDPAGNLSKLPGIPTSQEKHAEKYAQADPLRMRLSILGNSTVVAKEPFFGRLEFTNPSGKNIAMVDGGCRGSTLYFAVKTAEGTTLFETSRPRYGDYISHTWTIQPGETYSRILSLSGLYNFATPGEYLIVARRYKDSMEDIVLNEASAKLKVLPYNSVVLKSRCDGLLASLQAGKESPQEGLSLGLSTKALYSVQDNVVLPHLEWMAKTWSGAQGDVIRSAQRIGTAEAKALVAKYADIEGPVGKLARDATPETGGGNWAWNIDLGPFQKDPPGRNANRPGAR